MKKFLLFILVFAPLFMWSQNTIQGKVIDATSGDALIGATVIEKGTSNGTITDFNGSYSLNVSEVSMRNFDG